MLNKDYYTIIDLGFGAKDIIKVKTLYNIDKYKWVPVTIDNTPKSWDSTGNTFLINCNEQMVVNKKYLFDTLDEALNYLEGEL